MQEQCVLCNGTGMAPKIRSWKDPAVWQLKGDPVKRFFFSTIREWPALGITVGRTNMSGWYFTLSFLRWQVTGWSRPQ